MKSLSQYCKVGHIEIVKNYCCNLYLKLLVITEKIIPESFSNLFLVPKIKVDFSTFIYMSESESESENQNQKIFIH